MKNIIILTLLLISNVAFAEDWKNNLTNEKEFISISKKSKGLEFSKFIIDVKTNKVIFFDVNRYPLHVDFVFEKLNKQPKTDKNILKYNLNYQSVKPNYILGYITKYDKLNITTFSFWEGDDITYKDINKTYEILKSSTYIKDIYFRPDSNKQEKIVSDIKPNFKVITNDKLYKSAPYRSFNNGVAIGILKFVNSNSSFNKNDIVVLDKPYLDITPVAGIINTKETTPLSHVNLRATAWNIPSANILTNFSEYYKYNNKYVYYNVADSNFTLRLASQKEIDNYKEKSIKKVNVPSVNLENNKIKFLADISSEEVVSYGAKTSNLGNLQLELSNISVPDGYGIPFHYYKKHITGNIENKINAVLNDKRFLVDDNWTKNNLEDIKNEISKKPLDKDFLNKVNKIWQEELIGLPIFIRSSTNAEDLKGFNGAGLYDTVANVNSTAKLEQAIKKVWASIWNEIAVKERAFYNIEQNKIYPGILMQVGVNATAAGVLITKDLYGGQDNTYTINANWGLGMSVVEGKKIPEQVLFDSNNEGMRIISRSNESKALVYDEVNGIKEVLITPGKTILTDSIIKNLGNIAKEIQIKYNYPIDIEWVLEKNKIWIVQIRPYVESGVNNE